MINMILLPESQNAKTGNIIQSYSSPSSCPVSCPDKGNHLQGMPSLLTRQGSCGNL